MTAAIMCPDSIIVGDKIAATINIIVALLLVRTQ